MGNENEETERRYIRELLAYKIEGIMGQQVDQLAYEAVSLLVEQMNEQKKRKPVALETPIHKVIPPVFYRRETTEKQ